MHLRFRMDRRSTRARNGVQEVAQYLADLSKVKPGQAGDPQASLRAAVHARLPAAMHASPAFVDALESALLTFLRSLLRNMSVVSANRAELQNVSQSPTHRSTSLEEWLLHKEDCAVRFSKLFHSSNDTSIPSKADYSAHAAEEEQRNLLTAQSVRRLSLQDLLLPESIPERAAAHALACICRAQLSAEYLAS